MSLTLKILSSFIGVVGVGGTILGVTLTKESNKKTKKAEKTLIVAKLMQNIVESFDPTKDKYSCQLSLVENNDSESKKIDNNCEIVPIIFGKDLNFLNLSSINSLKPFSENTFDEIKNVAFWTIKFNSQKLTNVKFDKSNDIDILINDKKLFSLSPALEIKNNNFVKGINNLLVVKTENTETFSEFTNNWNDNAYHCVFKENETLVARKNTCIISFFNKEIPVSETATPSKFEFNDLTTLILDKKTKNNYLSKVVKKNQYYVLFLEESDLSKITTSTPIYYYEKHDTNSTINKKTTFYPVMNIFGWIQQLDVSDKTQIYNINLI